MLEERLAAPLGTSISKEEHVKNILQELSSASQPRSGAEGFSHLEQHADIIK